MNKYVACKFKEVAYHVFFRHWTHTANEYIRYHLQLSNYKPKTHRRIISQTLRDSVQLFIAAPLLNK